jgi:preprotein translocase subunit SecD
MLKNTVFLRVSTINQDVIIIPHLFNRRYRMRSYAGILVLAASLTVLPALGFAQDTHKNQRNHMEFQVVQNQLVFDNSLIEHASFIKNKDGTFGGLEVTLKPSASEELKRITAAGIGKVANLVINDRIVSSAKLQSSLEHKFLITDIAKEDAQKFVDSLQAN